MMVVPRMPLKPQAGITVFWPTLMGAYSDNVPKEINDKLRIVR